jgi:hypothetical protein
MAQEVNFEISTLCSCQDEMEDGEFQPSPECYGCWDDLLEMFSWEVYKPWLEANQLEDSALIAIHYSNMDWDKKAGVFDLPARELRELEPLKLRGDFTLRFKLDGASLTAVRSSHDEVGASFIFEPVGKELANA